MTQSFKPENEAALSKYNSNDYRTPDGYTSDIVLFTIVSENVPKQERRPAERTLKLLLIQRSSFTKEGTPNIEANKWALPGGFVNPSETAYEAAIRELKEETNVDYFHLEHIGVFDKIGRDDRGWMISSAFYGIVPEHQLRNKQAGDDASKVELIDFSKVYELDLAFDHRKIIELAYQKLVNDMLQTTVAKNFLPEEFTLSELQKVLMLVTNEYNVVEKSVFNEKIPKLPFIEIIFDEKGKKKKTNRTAYRPTQLYRFNNTKIIKHIYQ